MAIPLCYYGSAEPLPTRRLLRAGPLSAVYESGDLRYVRCGGVEVCRRWYAAVRDYNWGTVPRVLTDERIEEYPSGFRITYDCTHRQRDIHFVWRAEIAARPDQITFTFDGEAKATFKRNRLGFCVLHPPGTCVGMAVTLHHPGGRTTATRFPELIAPANPFQVLTGLDHELPGTGRVSWRFEGDEFETEDQRNWTDASYKTFCTPLARPFPVEVPIGTRVRQVVTLKLEVPSAAEYREAEPVVTVGTTPTYRLPALGLGIASHGPPLTPPEARRIRALRPEHLRVELDLTGTGWRGRLLAAATDADAVGAGLEFALTLSEAARREMAYFLAELRGVSVPTARLLVFDRRSWGTPGHTTELAAEALREAGVKVPLFAGTLANFTELNRNRPPPDRLDGLCYSIHPQQHAFDNASLVECCAMAADTVVSARAFSGGRPIAVTPITLRERVNPYATGPAPPLPPGELPPAVDVRQMSLFGAGWTLGTLKYLAESGASSATFYETVGWLGVTERDGGTTLPEKFPSLPGMAFPLYHVLADASECAGAEVLPCGSVDPLRFDALALRHSGKTRVLAANLTVEPLTVSIRGLGGRAVARFLDETTFDQAASNPEDFRAESGNEVPTVNGEVLLALRPFAYARLDAG